MYRFVAFNFISSNSKCHTLAPGLRYEIELFHTQTSPCVHLVGKHGFQIGSDYFLTSEQIVICTVLSLQMPFKHRIEMIDYTCLHLLCV